MISFLLTALAYILLTISASQFLLSIPVPMLLLLLYVIPIIINFIVQRLQEKRFRLMSSLILPSFSLLYYLGFSYLTSSTGTWSQFIQANEFSNSQMSLNITTNLFASSQLIFVGLLFYGISLATVIISNKVNAKEGEKKYA